MNKEELEKLEEKAIAMSKFDEGCVFEKIEYYDFTNQTNETIGIMIAIHMKPQKESLYYSPREEENIYEDKELEDGYVVTFNISKEEGLEKIDFHHCGDFISEYFNSTEEAKEFSISREKALEKIPDTSDYISF